MHLFAYDIVDHAGKRINQQSANDVLINAEVILPDRDHQHMAKVPRCSVDENGNLIGTFDKDAIAELPPL